MSKLLVLLCILAVSCGERRDPPSEVGYSPSPALQAQAELYLRLAKEQQGASGFVEAEACDSVLFSGLAGAGGLKVDLLDARRPDGRWERRPLSLGSCLEQGLSKSSVSRDMLLGVFWWAWREGRLDVLEDLKQNLVANRGVFGESDGSLDGQSRVLFTPTLAGVLYRLLAALGGERSAVRFVPDLANPVPRGFQRHLHALSLALRQEAGETLSDAARGVLELYKSEDPKNPLFPAVLGEKALAEKLLTEGWPQGRLPTGADWCSIWKLERADNDSSLSPCPEKQKVHSGGDFLFVYSLLKR